MRTAVVILNWNTKRYLERFLPELLKSCEARDAGVIVADSASMDGSIELLAEKFPQVRTIALDDNYGFTGGYNRALDGLDSEFYVLMNSDVSVPENWLDPLVSYMDEHPDCAVCAPKLHAMNIVMGPTDRFEYAGAAGGYVDRFGYPFCRGRVLRRTETDRGQYDGPADVLWVSGACMMVRSSVWKELGGLDGRFFAHMEEIDFCWRAQLGGWKVGVVPQSVVWHLGGGTLPQTSPWKLELNYRNNLLMLDKNLAATLEARGLSHERAARKASMRISFRMMLDWGSAFVYLVTGNIDDLKALCAAHRGFRRMRGNHTDMHLSAVPGYRKVCILPLSMLMGNGVFKYLRRYEDSH